MAFAYRRPGDASGLMIAAEQGRAINRAPAREVLEETADLFEG